MVNFFSLSFIVPTPYSKTSPLALPRGILQLVILRRCCLGCKLQPTLTPSLILFLLKITKDQESRESWRTKADAISSRLLRQCADQLSGLVQYISNLSLSLNSVPLLVENLLCGASAKDSPSHWTKPLKTCCLTLPWRGSSKVTFTHFWALKIPSTALWWAWAASLTQDCCTVSVATAGPSCLQQSGRP